VLAFLSVLFLARRMVAPNQIPQIQIKGLQPERKSQHKSLGLIPLPQRIESGSLR